ncbi:TonB-dependent receptor [Komagataeibacter nataicola]|uniref:TonB-dependent receptor n=1 Tax=Komagataeibacter nataicola TaxID=265960 RepID=A0A9N7H2H7_9PROT|nr:TonB-dependent receptor [Komagataeibacter nataicola]
MVYLPSAGHAAVDRFSDDSAATGRAAPVKSRASTRRQPAAQPAAEATGQSAQAMGTRPEILHVSTNFSATGASGTTPGGGLLARQTVPRIQSGLTRDYIAKQSPTTNTLNLVKMLPGAIVANSDPLGISDRTTLSVRGLDQTEIGLVFEGMPAGDPIYNLADTSEWVDSENIGRVDLAQGTNDIAAPVYNAVGGTLTETLRDPSHHFGGTLGLSGGNHSTNKDFIRFDTGDIGRTGVRAFASFSYTQNNNWRGPGGNSRFHVDAKLVKDWGRHGRSSAVFTWNQVNVDPLTYPTLAQWQEYGKSYNYSGSYTPGTTNYYKLYHYQRTSLMLSLPNHFDVNRALSIDFTPYYQWMSGLVPGGATLSDSSGIYYGDQKATPIDLPYATRTGTSTVASNAYSGTYNTGFNGYLTLHTGINQLRMGYWYSNLTKDSLYYYSLVNNAGQIDHNPLHTAGGDVLAYRNFHMYQQVNGFFIEDTLSLLHDRLHLTAGFKEVLLTRQGTNALPGAQYSWTSNDAQPLPRVAINYAIDKHNQIFISGNTNFHAPSSDVPYFDSFSVTTGALSSKGSNSLKDEYSISEEIGYRYSGLFNFSLGLFNYNFTNRQISTTEYLYGAPTSVYINAGGQTSRGIEAEFGLRPWHHFSPYISGQYLHATIDNNLKVGNDYLPTAGKEAVMSPKFSGAIGISYDNGHFFGNMSFNYVDSQYATFMNDQSIPARKTADITLGYRLKGNNYIKKPEMQVNLINVGDSNYLSGIYTVRPNAKTTTGVNGTQIAGASPAYYLGGGFAVVATFTSGF